MRRCFSKNMSGRSGKRAQSSRRASLARDILGTQLPLTFPADIHANPSSLLSLFICLYACNQLAPDISIVGCRFRIYLLRHSDGVSPPRCSFPNRGRWPFSAFSAWMLSQILGLMMLMPTNVSRSDQDRLIIPSILIITEINPALG